MGKKLTTEQFIEKAISVHGDRYDYSESEYNGRDKKITIGCPSHGSIEVVADGHLKGLGCNTCYFDRVRKKAKDKFLKKSADVHSGSGYDYSLVDYKNIDTKVKIVCPVHGIFETTPHRHMNGVACQKCSGPNYRGFLKNADKTRLSKKEFVSRAIAAHGKKYDYSKAEYKNNRKKVEIICPQHGPFFQTPDNHMKGCGCELCKFEKTVESLKKAARRAHKKAKKEYIGKVKKIHGDKYDYSEVEYTSWDGDIKIICQKHGPFLQTANGHKQGHGCPQCAQSGFDGSLPAMLYYLEIKETSDSDPIYKIGITNRTVRERYCLERDREKITVLRVWEYPIGSLARKAERGIVKKYKNHAFLGNPPLDGVGTAEMFSRDVLGLSETSVEAA